MKSQLASLEINYLIKEFKVLIGGRIDKIFQVDKKEFYFQFYVSNVGKKILRITDKLIYLTARKPVVEEPPGFCMFLRKQLDNSRLKEINQKESERIIEFLFETKEGKKKLIVELFGGGNLLILDENDVILSAAHYEKYKDRDVLAKSSYKYPQMNYNFFDLKLKDLKELFGKTEKDSLVKCLAVELGLGGVYSEEVCLLSKLDKNETPSGINNKETNEIFSIIKKIINKKINPIIVYDKEAVDVVPFSLELYKGLEVKKFKTFNEALDYYFTNEFKEVKKKSAYELKLEKLERIIEEQKIMIKEMEKGEKENRAKAELIYNNYQMVKEILDEIKKAKKKYSWEEIKDKLKGHKIIKEVDVKEKRVVVEVR